MSFDSALFWEQRYARGDDSGSGSRGFNAKFKAGYINSFISRHGVNNVVEFGCGDGEQLRLASYPVYLGFDVSPTAIRLCESIHSRPGWSFKLYPSKGIVKGWDLALSLDVIYHLVEDEVFERHMADVFGASRRYVILYTTDWKTDEASDVHVRHRPVSPYVEANFPDWVMIDFVKNPEPQYGGCDFLAYERRNDE